MPELHALLLKTPPFSSSADSWAYPLDIKKTRVPRLAPTTPAQAQTWTVQYWPTFYRKTTPFGAHPGSITRAEEELQHTYGETVSVEHGMELAELAAKATKDQGFGIETGCVIVERIEGKTEIIAVAGDARHKSLSPATGASPEKGCQGNVMAHAVMRALGFVGRKRLRVASQNVARNAAKAERNFANVGLVHDERARDAFFLDLPITPIEQEHFDKNNILPDGYLCLKLEVYLTHEPCIMCSMALVHSRVGRVIFKHRMPDTGGLTAELVSNDTGPVGLGYGLCWRKELNWQFMCWEYIHANKKQGADGEELKVGANGAATAVASLTLDRREKYIANGSAIDSSFASVHV